MSWCWVMGQDMHVQESNCQSHNSHRASIYLQHRRPLQSCGGLHTGLDCGALFDDGGRGHLTSQQGRPLSLKHRSGCIRGNQVHVYKYAISVSACVHVSSKCWYLYRSDLDRWSAGWGCRSWCHGTLGLWLGLHLGQGLLVDHQQLPTLTANQDHPCKKQMKGWGSKVKACLSSYLHTLCQM